jgi:fatty acyl-CoA reductase
MLLRERLAGRQILLTGVTGFVGRALLHRLLTGFPDTRPVLLVRATPGRTGTDRVRGALSELGLDPEQELARLTVIDGDLEQPPALPDDLDVVIHCAGDVSFDSPIDLAFRTNVRGTEKLLEAVRASGSRPHYVHVSTAYVGGRRRGVVPEERIAHTVDWRAETSAALGLRGRVEEESRLPDRLARLRSEAERAHGREGPLTVATDAERRRVDWVRDQLVRAGTNRAHSLGWTDVYTFSKAMAERCVEQLVGDLPVSVVRPSIIESALRTPWPGWIHGYKMAEPLILAYGRGELPEFAAAPDAVFDVVPVDFVASALLAVAATAPTPDSPEYFHVGSGARNPLTYHRLYSLVRSYFQAHPLEAPRRGATRVANWSWPGGEAVERLLRAGERAADAADAVLVRLPRSDRARDWAGRVDRQQRRLAFLRRYHDLYRPYVETQLAFVDDHTAALTGALDPTDVEAHGFDTAEIDWDHYIREVHCPSVTAAMRSVRPSRSTGPRRAAAPEPGDGVLAVFDLDGTLVSSNVVESYLWLRLRDLAPARRPAELARVARRLPGYLSADRHDRTDLLRAVYRRYEGALLAELDRLVDEDVADLVLARTNSAAVRCVRRHRAAGHRTVLVTGGIRPLTRPFATLFDEVVGADLAVDPDGRCTGFLVAPPLVGEARAAWLARHAATVGADLGRSYAYADSATDLPMLRAVGHPVAVNPDVALHRVARRHRWPIEEWTTPGAPLARSLALIGSER